MGGCVWTAAQWNALPDGSTHTPYDSSVHVCYPANRLAALHARGAQLRKSRRAGEMWQHLLNFLERVGHELQFLGVGGVDCNVHHKLLHKPHATLVVLDPCWDIAEFKVALIQTLKETHESVTVSSKSNNIP